MRVKEIADLFDAAEVLHSRKLPRGPKLAIVTAAGAPGVIAADALIDLGGELAVLSDESMQRLNQCLPPFWSKGNPVDLRGNADAARYRTAINVCLGDPGVDGVLVIYVPLDDVPPDEVARVVIDTARETGKPIVTAWMGGEKIRRAMKTLRQNNIPSYESPEKAVRAYANMYRYERNLKLLYETPAELPVHEASQEDLKDFTKRLW